MAYSSALQLALLLPWFSMFVALILCSGFLSLLPTPWIFFWSSWDLSLFITWLCFPLAHFIGHPATFFKEHLSEVLHKSNDYNS